MKIKQSLILLMAIATISCSSPQESFIKESLTATSLDASSSSSPASKIEFRVYQVYPKTLVGGYMEIRFDKSIFIEEGKKLYKSDVFAEIRPEFKTANGSGPTYTISDIYLDLNLSIPMYGNMVATNNMDLFYYCTGTGVYDYL